MTDTTPVVPENANPSRTAEEVLRAFVDHLEVNIPKEGLCKGCMTLWFLPDPNDRHVRFGLIVAKGSYDEAFLNSIGGMLNAAREALDLPLLTE